MHEISTNQLSLTACKKNLKSTDVRFLPQSVKCAAALNNLNNYFFDWNRKKKR